MGPTKGEAPAPPPERLATDGRLPTFIVIGAAKAGTTSLYHYLRRHPLIFMPDRRLISAARFAHDQQSSTGRMRSHRAAVTGYDSN